MSSNQPSYLTLDDLAERWQVNPKWIYSNHRRLGIPRLHLGRQLRFPIREVEEWELRNLENQVLLP